MTQNIHQAEKARAKHLASVWSDGYDSRVAGHPPSSCKRISEEDRTAWLQGWERADDIIRASAAALAL